MLLIVPSPHLHSPSPATPLPPSPIPTVPQEDVSRISHCPQISFLCHPKWDHPQIPLLCPQTACQTSTASAPQHPCPESPSLPRWAPHECFTAAIPVPCLFPTSILLGSPFPITLYFVAPQMDSSCPPIPYHQDPSHLTLVCVTSLLSPMPFCQLLALYSSSTVLGQPQPLLPHGVGRVPWGTAGCPGSGTSLCPPVTVSARTWGGHRACGLWGGEGISVFNTMHTCMDSLLLDCATLALHKAAAGMQVWIA